MDYEHEFELPLKVAGKPIAMVCGKADLAWDEGYGFVVTGIELATEDGGTLRLNERCDDPELVKLFRDISAELYDDSDAEERFAEALAEYQREAA